MPHLSSSSTFSVCILRPASSPFSHCSPSSFCITATPPFSPTVAPDTINNHVKTCHEEQKNFHFYAPEYGGRTWAELLFLLVPAISWPPGETRWTQSDIRRYYFFFKYIFGMMFLTKLDHIWTMRIWSDRRFFCCCWMSSPCSQQVFDVTTWLWSIIHTHTRLFFFFCFFYSFPNFRCWCHHSCWHLLIWHGCFGGESPYIDRMAWDPLLSNTWTCVMVCADGASGNPWEWRVLLCLPGGHQQCHTVTGGPPAEGEMKTVKYTFKCSSVAW